MYLKRTRSLAQFGIVNLDFLANYLCFGAIVVSLGSVEQQQLQRLPGPLFLYVSMNLYFMVTVPFLGGRTPAMVLFRKTVLVDGHQPPFSRNLAHGLIYLPTIFVAYCVLIFSHRRAFDVFLNYCMHDLPKKRPGSQKD